MTPRTGVLGPARRAHPARPDARREADRGARLPVRRPRYPRWRRAGAGDARRGRSCPRRPGAAHRARGVRAVPKRWETLVTRCDTLISPVTLATMSGSDIDPPALLRNRATVYLQVPEARLGDLRSFLRLMWTSLIQQLVAASDRMGADHPPLLLILDEAGGTSFTDLPDQLVTLRSRRISCSVLVQALSQLRAATRTPSWATAPCTSTPAARTSRPRSMSPSGSAWRKRSSAPSPTPRRKHHSGSAPPLPAPASTPTGQADAGPCGRRLPLRLPASRLRTDGLGVSTQHLAAVGDATALADHARSRCPLPHAPPQDT
jgi:hypothetical protein